MCLIFNNCLVYLFEENYINMQSQNCEFRIPASRVGIIARLIPVTIFKDQTHVQLPQPLRKFKQN